MDLATLRSEHFRPHKGTSFTFHHEGGALDMVLHLIEHGPESQREGGGFSVIWAGPKDPALPQSTYKIEHAEMGASEVFVVPIGHSGDHALYEAVFN